MAHERYWESTCFPSGAREIFVPSPIPHWSRGKYTGVRRMPATWLLPRMRVAQCGRGSKSGAAGFHPPIRIQPLRRWLSESASARFRSDKTQLFSALGERFIRADQLLIKRMAEEEGFEPPCESPRKRFSRPPVSTTHPFLRSYSIISRLAVTPRRLP